MATGWFTPRCRWSLKRWNELLIPENSLREQIGTNREWLLFGSSLFPKQSIVGIRSKHLDDAFNPFRQPVDLLTGIIESERGTYRAIDT